MLAQEGFIWPTDASPYLTSTFGETRSAHYHSGLDIKTWGKEGYKVFASKEGIVHRLSISESGYGRAIYLKHPDGYYTLYAHLERLNDELQNYVDSLRLRDYSFEIDVNIEHLGLKINKGDIIGYTGSTGVGPPHLHFEIRDTLGNPINALRSNLTVKDSIPPTLSALMVYPLSNSSTIRGSQFPQLYYPYKDKTGTVNFDTIKASGPVGLAISTFDEADGVSNKYAIYELGIISQQDTLFYQKIDEFRFEEADLMFNDRIQALGATRRAYQTLYKKDGPENPFYRFVDDRSKINPGDSIASFTLFAKDFYGNESTAKLILDGSYNFPIKTSEEKPFYDWHWTEDWVFTGSKTISFVNANFGTMWNSASKQRLLFSKNQQTLFSRIYPDSKAEIISPSKDLKLEFKKDTFFDSLTVSINTGIINGNNYLNIQPRIIPSRKEFKLEFYLKDNFEPEENYRLFRFDRINNRISYVDSRLVGKTIHGWPSALGEFLILPDNDPPRIDSPRIFKTKYGKWLISIPAKDDLSGIDFKNSQIFVNSIQGIVEYDSENNLLIYYHPDFTPEKSNIITINTSDLSGNKIRRNFQVQSF